MVERSNTRSSGGGRLLSMALAVAIAVGGIAGVASANWSSSFAISDAETEAYGHFAQAVGPDGASAIAWVTWAATGEPQTVELRRLGADGSFAPIQRLSEPADPEDFETYISSVDLDYSAGGVATAVWLEILLSGSACVSYGYGEYIGGAEDCTVSYLVRARRIGAGGSLGPVRTLGESEYSVGAEDATYLATPQVAVDSSGVATVGWTETTASAGCASHYGYGYEYEGGASECMVDASAKARRIDPTGAPLPTTMTVFQSHSEGSYGRSELGDVVVAADGAATLLWLNGPGLNFYSCAGEQEISIEARRIESAGGLGPTQQLDEGSADCGWTAPRADVASNGAVTAVWGRPGGVRHARIDPSGTPGAAQQIGSSLVYYPPDVGVAPGGAATVAWSDGETVKSRRIGSSLGSIRTLDTAPSSDYGYLNPQVATADDASTGIAWGVRSWDPESGPRSAVRGVAVDAAGNVGAVQGLQGLQRDWHFLRALPGLVGGGDGAVLAAWLVPGSGAEPWRSAKSAVRAARLLPASPPSPSSDSSSSSSTRPSVPPPAPPLPRSVPRSGIAFAAFIAKVSRGSAILALRCRRGGACRGALRLIVRVTSRARSKRARSSKRRQRNISIGATRFGIPAGKARRVRVRLNGKGKVLLRRAGRRGLRVSLRGRGIKPRTLKLKPVGGKRKGKRTRRR